MVRLTTHAGLWAIIVTAALPAGAAAREPMRFKLGVEEAGVYTLSYEDLSASGLASPVPASAIGLSSGGKPVPVWIDDVGEDGDFGPGDRLEFLGRELTGEAGHFNEFSRFNVYWVDTAAREPLVGTERQAEPATCSGGGELVSRRHLEDNRLRVRFASGPTDRGDIWYWARLAHTDTEPFLVELPLEDLDIESSQPVKVTAHFKGWSSFRDKREDETDHLVALGMGAREVVRHAWNNSREGVLIDGLAVAPEQLAEAGGRLTVWVPARRDDNGAIIDVVLLDWVELEYAVPSRIAASVTPLWGSAEGPGPCIDMSRAGARLLTEQGVRWRGGGTVVVPGAFGSSNGTPVYLAHGPGAAVAWIEPAAPVDLGTRTAQVDYLMISDASLIEAVEPLAEFHRTRGLAVELVDVADIYDEFNHGVVHPRAIRDFLAQAYAQRPPPAPRFVLLVGDASWDLSDEPVDDANYANMSYELALSYGLKPRRSPAHQFGRKKLAGYEQKAAAAWRNLIPTWDHRTSDGPAASDNWLVDVVGGDLRPEMAIGRLPVVTVEEVQGIVDKTLAATRAREAGAARRAVLVTDAYQQSRFHAEKLAERLVAAGFATTKIYPGAVAAGADEYSSGTDAAETVDPSLPLLAAFDAGPELVYFVGHGGRFEWRTGRPDLEEQTDLFTLDHLNRLNDQSSVLPVVVSMACYSAPFDHPSADSIGEKLLRLPSKGAVAVIAAAWRITPSTRTGLELLDELSRGGTLGEALLRLKRRTGDFQFVTQFNLLGDPAIPLSPWASGRDFD